MKKLLLSCLMGSLSLTFNLAAQGRDAEAILRDYQAVKMPTLDNSRRADQAYIRTYVEEQNQATQKRSDLALELFKADPKHPRAVPMVLERWMTLAQRGQGEKVYEETGQFLKDYPESPQKAEVLFRRALAVLYTGRNDARLLPAVEEFAAAAPKDERGAQLLTMLASQQSTPADQLKMYRRVVEQYAGSRAAGTAEGKLKQVERVGKPFDLAFTEAIAGQTVSMENLRGKVVVIDYWATWCGPCVVEMPKMKQLYAEYKPRGVEFIGVSLDQPEAQGGLTKLKEFCAKENITWPQYYQGNGWESGFSRSWGINSIPSVFIIDANGNLYSTEARGKLETLIPELLAKRDNKAS